MDFNSPIDKLLALNGKVIEGLRKVAYAIFFFCVDSMDRRTVLLNFWYPPLIYINTFNVLIKGNNTFLLVGFLHEPLPQKNKNESI